MNPKNVTTNYDCSEEVSSNESNITALYFKKAEQPSAKVVDLTQYHKNAQKSPVKAGSLNTVFKQVFGEGLTSLGFVKIKGRQPYFVRLIGDEILHIIVYMPRPGKYFEILGGVATVYRHHLSLDENPRHNLNWLKHISAFYNESNPFEENPKYSFYDLNEFYYEEETKYNIFGKAIQKPNVHGTIIDVFKHSLKLTKEIILPTFDKVVDTDSCIEYFLKFELKMRIYDDLEGFFSKNFHNFYNEGLLYVTSGNRNLFIKKSELSLETRLVGITHSIERGRSKYTPSPKDFQSIGHQNP